MFSYFALFVVTQVVAISIIVFVLIKLLNAMLTESGIRNLEFGIQSKQITADDQIVMISHKELKSKYKDEIQRITHKYLGHEVKVGYERDRSILGGVILKVGEKRFDCSIKDRLDQALSRK